MDEVIENKKKDSYKDRKEKGNNRGSPRREVENGKETRKEESKVAFESVLDDCAQCRSATFINTKIRKHNENPALMEPHEIK